MDLENPDQSDRSQDDSERYFDEVTEAVRTLKAEINRLTDVVNTIERINRQFKEIDCNHGCATVDISRKSQYIKITGEAWVPPEDVGEFNLLRTDAWDDQSLEWDGDRSLAGVTVKKTLSLEGNRDAE